MVRTTFTLTTNEMYSRQPFAILEEEAKVREEEEDHHHYQTRIDPRMQAMAQTVGAGSVKICMLLHPPQDEASLNVSRKGDWRQLQL